jgi:hypothetical protein
MPRRSRAPSPNPWIAYDPTWLVDLARVREPELVAALTKCKRAQVESKAYIAFVVSDVPNQPGSEWQFARNVHLHDPAHGHLVLDVLEDGRVGGVEFLDRL